MPFVSSNPRPAGTIGKQLEPTVQTKSGPQAGPRTDLLCWIWPGLTGVLAGEDHLAQDEL